MIEFYNEQFVGGWIALHGWWRDRIASMAGNSTTASNAITEEDRAFLRLNLRAITTECERLEMNSAYVASNALISQLGPNGSVANYASLYPALEAFLIQLEYNFANSRFVFIPGDRWQYFESGNLFDLPRPSPIPSADQDIRDAGNAYALDLHTACVFHLMRVAEIGLRVFAKHLRVTLPKKKGQPVPLAWAQWEDVLKAIHNKIDLLTVAPGKSAPHKAEIRAFYRGVFGEFQAFKDVYRNEIMHVRRTYDQPEAASALEHVGEFIKRLVTRVHE